MWIRALTILGWLCISGFIGYLLGSIPTAFLLVRWKKKMDVREAGSGNVGMLNSYTVSGSYVIAGTVLLFDIAKGAGAVLLSDKIVGIGFVYLAAAGIGAVLGHNFPVWLRFNGGRGLATAAGVALVISWHLIAIWAVFWSAGYIMSRRVNIANAIATSLTLISILIAPSHLVRQIAPADAVTLHFKFFCVLLFGLILIKHIEPIMHRVKEVRNARNSHEESSDGGS